MIGRWLSVYLPTRLISREMKRLTYRLENEDDNKKVRKMVKKILFLFETLCFEEKRASE